MPVKNRAARLRLDPERELRAWRGVFRSGFDFLNSLADVGVATERHRPSIEAARNAWGRLGGAWLASTAFVAADPRGDPWALREFGKPNSRHHRARPLGR